MRKVIHRSKTRESIESEVASKYGQLATIESIQEVETGGVAGFFATREYDATVVVPEAGDQSAPVLNKVIDKDNIAELLTNDVLPVPDRSRRTAAPMLDNEPVAQALKTLGRKPAAKSKDSHTIDGVMRMVGRDTTSESLTLFVGLFKDSVDLLGRKAYQAGELNEQAEPVSGEVAYGIGDGSSTTLWAQKASKLKPDQVFAVVDPSRKHEDSALWVHELNSVIAVAGVVAAPFAARTITPGTLNLLGYPVTNR